jgi:hypothetical protein
MVLAGNTGLPIRYFLGLLLRHDAGILGWLMTAGNRKQANGG